MIIIVATMTAAILQGIDVYMTLSAGGIEVEGNPFALFLWAHFGLYLILFVKLAAVVIFTLAWRFFDSLEERFKRVARILLCTEFYGLMIFVLFINYMVVTRSNQLSPSTNQLVHIDYVIIVPSATTPVPLPRITIVPSATRIPTSTPTPTMAFVSPLPTTATILATPTQGCNDAEKR